MCWNVIPENNNSLVQFNLAKYFFGMRSVSVSFTKETSSDFSYGFVYVEPPSIANKTSSPAVFVGDSLILHCSAHGYPQPVVRWYKDGSFVHTNTSLQFSSLKESNSGLYLCNATNDAGNDTYEVQVVVRGNV